MAVNVSTITIVTPTTVGSSTLSGTIMILSYAATSVGSSEPATDSDPSRTTTVVVPAVVGAVVGVAMILGFWAWYRRQVTQRELENSLLQSARSARPATPSAATPQYEKRAPHMPMASPSGLYGYHLENAAYMPSPWPYSQPSYPYHNRSTSY